MIDEYNDEDARNTIDYFNTLLLITSAVEGYKQAQEKISEDKRFFENFSDLIDKIKD